MPTPLVAYPDRMNSAAVVWHHCIATLLRSSRLAPPSSVVDTINEAVHPIGIRVVVYLVDREQQALRALPRTGVHQPEPIPIDTTLAGRTFTTGQPGASAGKPDRLWLLLLDGSERLGVMEVLLPENVAADDPSVREGAELLAIVVGYLLVSKLPYGDTIRRTRRSQAMSTGGELLWRALPPRTCATKDMVLAAALEPCYDVGGDAFDYAIDHDLLRVAIFDAVGHGLAAALTSTLTLAATRAARAKGLDLPATAAAGDEAITGQFRDLRYTTAILAELDLTTGVLQYLNAGHPPAVIMRDGKVVVTLDSVGRTPLGLPDRARVAHESLQPGDRLLFYTDGITEARDPDGEFFGLTRLLDLAERHAAAGLSAPETLRRLSHAVLDHQHGQLDDDATLMIVEWSPQARQAEPATARARAEPDPDEIQLAEANEILTFTTTAAGQQDAIVVHPAGVIGLAGAAHLERALTAYIEGGQPKVILDISNVSLVDSAGLTALLRVHRTATAHLGWLRLVNPRPRVRRIIQTANVARLISVHDSAAEAVAAP
jgi:sigma-B regulation protein RsbU (phosphoserine phosphatase)